MAAGNTLAATLCYICAGNIDKTVEIWSRTLAQDHDGKSYVDRLQVSILTSGAHSILKLGSTCVNFWSCRT